MSTTTIGFIGIGVLVLALFFKVPVAAAMAVVGFAGFTYLAGLRPALGVLGTEPYASVASYGMSVIPLFILMGLFCFRSGISQDLYSSARIWLGRLRGGLAMATVGGCAAFAAVSGSSAATGATMGTVALPEMKKAGYNDALSTGAIAAGGTIGILIPPSVNMIIYAMITEQSIGRLFAAGIIPGILEAAFYIATIYILCRLNPLQGPPGPQTSWREKLVSLRSVWAVLVLFLLVMGGIYMGIFTPSEAGAVGAFGSFLFIIGKRRLTWHILRSVLTETAMTTAMIMFIFIGAMIFAYFLSISRIPMEMASWSSELQVNKYIVLAATLFVFLALGCIMAPVAIMLVVVPVIFPLVLAMGFDPIWFGVLMTRMCEIGFITPPVGINVYVIKGVAKDVPLSTIFRGIVPFLMADIVHVVLLVAVPQLSLLLPSLMVGK